VLLADESIRGRVVSWTREFADDDVVVLAPEPAPEWDDAGVPGWSARVERRAQLNGQLRRIGAVDVVVNLLPADRLPEGCSGHLDLFLVVVRHLVRGGVFIHDRTTAPGEVSASLAEWLGFLDAAEDPGRRGGLGRLETEATRSVGAVAITRDLVAVTKRQTHYIMLGDAEAATLLPGREPALAAQEIDTRPPGEFASRTTVHHHGEHVGDGGTPTLIRHPRLVTRHYQGRVGLSGRTLMFSGHTILPDSFRWHLTERPTNPLLRNIVGGFARIDRANLPGRTLEGDYYQLEAAYPSHYGHVMTEVLSRLWGWDEAKRRNPDLKLVFRPRPDKDPGVERVLFAAYGIAEDDVVAVAEPVWVDSVVSASPMWHNAEPYFAHPDLTDTWDRLGEGLLRNASAVDTGPRLFVSRSDVLAHRQCRNAREVEQYFADRGFTVIYPERHPLPDQVAMFREARVVAGFGGSAMFNIMHTRRLETLIVLNHMAYVARNEHLFASLKGGDSHYFWSAADLEQPDDEDLSFDAMHSSWEFDFATLGDDLERLLRGL
jgi:capsular polysaccharide biosynthesis protein